MPEEVELQAELTRLDEALSAIYRERRDVMAALADVRGEYELPPARLQTETQRKVASCPRCGGKLESERIPSG
jgi:hypothetical protein